MTLADLLVWVSRLFLLLHTHYSALGWVSCLLFLLSYPLLFPCLGITPILGDSIPTLSYWAGYLAYFSALIPTMTCLHGYHAYFFLLHTHDSLLAWVLHLFFRLHTHDDLFAWVSHLFLLLHTHADLRKQISKIKKRVCTPKYNIHTLFIKKSIPSYIVSYF